MKWLVQCPLCDNVLEEIMSEKHCTLDACRVRAMCVFTGQCRLDAAVVSVLLFSTRLCCSSPNHITKQFSTSPTSFNQSVPFLQGLRRTQKCTSRPLGLTISQPLHDHGLTIAYLLMRGCWAPRPIWSTSTVLYCYVPISDTHWLQKNETSYHGSIDYVRRAWWQID